MTGLSDSPAVAGRSDDLQVRLMVEEMIKYGYAALRNFPKSEKHVLSAEIRQSMFKKIQSWVLNTFKDKSWN